MINFAELVELNNYYSVQVFLLETGIQFCCYLCLQKLNNHSDNFRTFGGHLGDSSENPTLTEGKR